MPEDVIYNCRRCGKPFKPKKYWQKYCTARCRMLDWHEKEIEKLKREKK